MRKLILLASAAALLAGCTAVQTAQVAAARSSIATLVAQIGTFTVTDLSAAEADAVLHKDVVAIPCYPALADFVTHLQLPGAAPLTVAGAFLLHQQARDLANAVQANLGTQLVPPALKLACAAMVQDDVTFITNLAAIGGASAVLGPVAPALLGGVNATIAGALLAPK